MNLLGINKIEAFGIEVILLTALDYLTPTFRKKTLKEWISDIIKNPFQKYSYKTYKLIAYEESKNTTMIYLHELKLLFVNSSLYATILEDKSVIKKFVKNLPKEEFNMNEIKYSIEIRENYEKEITELKNKLKRYEETARIINIGEVIRGTRNKILMLKFDKNSLSQILNSEIEITKFINWLKNQVVNSFD